MNNYTDLEIPINHKLKLNILKDGDIYIKLLITYLLK